MAPPRRAASALTGIEPQDSSYSSLVEVGDGGSLGITNEKSFRWRRRKDAVAVAGWKPFTMTTPGLLSFALVSIALVVVIEVLAQKSARQGGLALSPSAQDIPAAATFSYLALPTAFSVIYSLAWTWIDLDIRRIQPWLELSRSDGALAESSLLLDYPFEFLAFVPFKASKHRHWPVFLSGIVMMVIFWLITPLQGAILGIQPITITETVGMSQPSVLMPLEQQAAAMDVSILNDGHSSTWLKQPFPPFTTAAYALLPFAPTDVDLSSLRDGNFTGNSVKLTTQLQCWPALVTPALDDGLTFQYDSGRGCKANVTAQPSSSGGNATYVVQYIGYWEDARLDNWLEGDDCGLNAAHQFLAIWAYTTLPRPKLYANNITALFCETSYQKQTVSVAVSATNLRPIDASVAALGDPVTLSENEFNTTAFEYLIGTGVPPVTISRDYPDQTVLEQYSMIFDKNISWPVTNMVGFALAHLNGSVAQLQNATVLHSVFELAHQAVFSIAAHTLSSTAAGSQSQFGITQYTLSGVVVSRPFALAVEILLLFVAALTGATLLVLLRTSSNLTKDPASMSSLFRLVGTSESVLDRFASMDCLDAKELLRRTKGQRYRLSLPNNSSVDPQLTLITAGDDTENQSQVSESSASYSSDRYYAPVNPKELRSLTGFVLVAVLVAAAAILLYLKEQESKLNGLSRPTGNFEVLQLLENYVPMVFATLLEPFLTLLNRLLCILQPFNELKKGKAQAKVTIETEYASLPPQLNILRALKSRHFLLAITCTIALMANVLTVALSAIFNEFAVPLELPVMLKPLRIPSLSRDSIIPWVFNTPFYDHFYVANANLSTGTSLPPWMDTQFAYFPFADSLPAGKNASSQYRAQTRGFGFNPNCSSLSTSPDSIVFANYSGLPNSLGFRNFTVSFRNPNGSVVSCDLTYGIKDEPILGISTLQVSSSLTTHKVFTNTGILYEQDDGLCGQYLVYGWMKADGPIPGGNLSMTLVQCRPTLQTALFNVTVDANGYILDSKKTSDLDDLSSFMNATEAASLVAQANSIITDTSREGGTDNGWHNTTITQDWLNYLLKLSLNGTRLVDPTQDIPDPGFVLPLVESMYRRLGASLLGLNLSLFKLATDPEPIQGTATGQETRIFMNGPAFVISVIVLLVDVLVVAFLYIRERSFYLPRLPSTIGSLVAYVAAGRAVREYAMQEEKGQRADMGPTRRATYSFGSFVGVDGKPHVGIELDPFVVPLDRSRLQRQGSSFLRAFSSRRSRGEGSAVGNVVV